MKSDPNDLDYDDWVTMAHAIKAALGPDREEHYGAFEDWCLKCPTATPEQSRKTWDSITTSRIGWRFIPYPAEVDFDDMPDDAAMDAAIEPHDFSEDALARRFADLHAENVRYAAKEGRWLEWDGSRWRPDDKLHLMTLARQFCRQVARGG